MRLTGPHLPTLLATTLLLAIVGIQISLSVRQNDGHFVYALDDPYIHMAMARNFARYGVWGVTRYEFSSSTSSLLWTLLLAAAYLVTSSAIVPLVLNIICGALVLVIANSMLRANLSDGYARLALLIGLVFLVPLPPLILIGMEHTFQIALCLVLVYSAASAIADRQFSLQNRNAKLLLAFSALAPAVRYESLFIVFVVVAMLAFRRRFLAALAVGAVAVTPLLIYGIISWKHGSFLLPNPLLIKGSMPRAGLSTFLQLALNRILSAPHLLFLWLLAIWLFLWKKEEPIWERDRVLLLIFILATILHIVFAGIGWFYRYEAYLVALGILIDGQSAIRVLTRHKVASARDRYLLPLALTMILSFAAGVILLLRATKAMAATITATKNIYEQQYQMANFLQTYYSGSAVAANDIGAINFMSDVRCLDLVGLGNAAVTRARINGNYNSGTMADLAQKHRVRIAVIYADWFESEGGVPRQWIKIGQWTTPNCVVCGNPVVSFYAVDKSEAEELRKHLEEFSPRLPGDVAQTGFDHKQDE